MIKTAPNKTYLTAGGYVVCVTDTLNATIETSPGRDTQGNLATDGSRPNIGWSFKRKIPFLNDEWSEKLTIVEELPFSLPKLPEGYKWAGGFPQFRIPEKGEHFFGMTPSYEFVFEELIFQRYVDNWLKNDATLGRRLIVERVATVPQPEHSVTVAEMASDIPDVGPGYRLIDIELDAPAPNDEYYSVTDRCWKIRCECACRFYNDGTFYRRKIGVAKAAQKFDVGVSSSTNGVVCATPQTSVASNIAETIWGTTSPEAPKEEIVMSNVVKFATVKTVLMTILAFTGKLVWRGANYWAFEPVKEVVTKIMRAVRYATLGTAVVGGIYAYNDPQGAKNLFWDCVPGISVEFKAPEILRG